MARKKHTSNAGKNSSPTTPATQPTTQQQQHTPTKAVTSALPTTPVAATGVASPQSPDVLSPASIKAFIPTRNNNINNPTIAPTNQQQQQRSPQLTSQQSDSPAGAHSEQQHAVKRTVQSLSSRASSSDTHAAHTPSPPQPKRPSISRILPGTVAQRAADYSAAVAASEQTASALVADVPQGEKHVAELVSQFSTVEQPAPTKQPTPSRRKQTQHSHTQAEAEADTASVNEKGAIEDNQQPLHATPVSASVEIGQQALEQHTATLRPPPASDHSVTSAANETEPVPIALLNTREVQAQQSALVETDTEPATSSITLMPQQQQKQSRQVRRSNSTAVSHVQPVIEHAPIATPPPPKQPLSTPSPVTQRPVDAITALRPRAESVLTRLVRSLWQLCVCCVWLALLLCGVDLSSRAPTLESAILSGLAAVALIANLWRVLRPKSTSSSSVGVSVSVLTAIAAIANSALPFLFARRIAAHSTMYVSTTARTHRNALITPACPPALLCLSLHFSPIYASHLSVVCVRCVVLWWCGQWLFCLHPGVLLVCVSVPLCCLTLLAVCRGATSPSRSVDGSSGSGASGGLLSDLSVLLSSAACLLCFAFSLALHHSSTLSFAPPYWTPWSSLPSQPPSHVRLIVVLQAVSVLSWLLTGDASQLGRCMSVLSLLLTEQHLRLPRVDMHF